MADWTKPTTSSAYAAYTTEIVNLFASLAKGMDSALIADTGVLTSTKRWNSTLYKWQTYNGSAWGDMAATYNISISGSAGSVTWNGVSGKPTTISGYGITDLVPTIAGKQTMWLPAGAMIPRITNGPSVGQIETATNKVQLSTLDFDQTTPEYAQFHICMPKNWNEGTLTAAITWSSAIAGTSAVVWALRAVAVSNDDPLEVAFGTAVSVTDAQTAVGDLMKTDETGAMTVAGTPAAGDMVMFELYRDASNGSDTLAGDARLHGIQVFYTTDALNDA